MNNQTLFVVGVFLAINILAFLVMWRDKVVSRRENATRISEGMIFFMAVMFGGVGVLAGMFTFRHKTRKWYFLVGIPLIMIQNFATLCLAWNFFARNANLCF